MNKIQTNIECGKLSGKKCSQKLTKQDWGDGDWRLTCDKCGFSDIKTERELKKYENDKN